MKHKIFIVLLVIFGCSKTRLDVAKNNIKAYIKTMLDNPKQYESVTWSKMDSSFYCNYDETPIGNRLLDSCLLSLSWLSISERRDLSDTFRKYTDFSKAAIMISYLDKHYPDKRAMRIDTLKAIIKPFKEERDKYNKQAPIFRGYEIYHSFRVKSNKKNSKLVRYRFFLDTALTVIGAEKEKIEVFD